jgi:uncharacterized membrane protein YbhN (UPF0104 family)
MMQKYRNRALIGGAIALTIYVVLLLALDNQGKITADLVTAFRDYAWGWLVVIALCHVLAGVFRFLEWQYFLGVIGARDKISVADSAIIFVFGFTMVVSPGKAAELLKSVFLKMKTGVPIARSAPVVIAERVVDGLAVIVILASVLVIAGPQLGLGDFLAFSQGVMALSLTLIGGGLIAVQVRPLAYLFLDIVGRVPLIRRAKDWLTALYESSREIFKLRHVIPTVAMGVGVYSSSILGFVVVLHSFGVIITPTLVKQSAFIVGISAAVGALSFVPNGAGVTEISTTAMLLAIVAPQHPEMTVGMAAAISLLDGFFHKWFRVLVGLAVGVLFRERLFSGDFAVAAADLDAYQAHHHTLAESTTEGK